MEPLRVAIVTDTALMNPWQASVVQALASEPSVHVTGHIHLGCGGPSGPCHRLSRRYRGAETGLEPMSVREAARAAPDIRFDVAIDLSATGLPGLAMALGIRVWSFRFGSNARDDARRASYRSISSGRPLTRLALVEAMPAEARPRIIREGTVGTAHWSLREQMAQLEDVARRWVVRAARRELGQRSVPYTSGDLGQRSRAQLASDCVDMGISPLLRVHVAMRLAVAAATSLVRNETWAIGIVRAAITDLVTSGPTPVQWLALEPGTFAADPFGYDDGGTLHIFFEQIRQSEGRGRIAHVAVAPDGTVTPPRIVLEPAVHASYPFLFRHDGRLYMLPETAAAQETVLYEATAPPFGWHPVARILPGERISDASVLYHAGRWWLFATMGRPGRDHTLGVWHAARPSGPWLPHADNPVKVDIRSARPAGTPFLLDGVLYRPAQNSAGSYGRQVALNRVDELTESRFRETTVRYLEADRDGPYPHGFHTVSACGIATLVDGKRVGFVAGATRRRIIHRLQGLQAKRVPIAPRDR